jgi:glutathione S-transferase
MRIIGSYASPYVRKVLACLALKGLDYEIDPITPFYGDAAFEAVSPLRRIPVLIDGDLALCDSSVICAYLDERYPDPPLLPADVADRARARWLEEFADTRMGDVFIWRLFQPLAITPAVWGEKGDRAVVDQTLNVDAPAVLDYLETQVPADGFLFGEIGLADISLATFFRNAGFVRFSIDAARWPRTAAFVARVLDHPALRALRPYEEVCMRNPIAKHREALAAAGAPVTAGSVATDTPQRGVMPI